MKNNIEGGKPRNLKETVQKLVGPIAALTLVTTGGPTGCKGETVNISLPPPTPAAAAATPQPTPAENPITKEDLQRFAAETVIKTVEETVKRLPTPAPQPTAIPSTENPITREDLQMLADEAAKKTVEETVKKLPTPASTPKALTVDDIDLSVKKALEEMKTPTPAPATPVPPIYMVSPFEGYPIPWSYTGHSNRFLFPEMRNQPNWINNPTTSELYVPNDGTGTITRDIGPSQIAVVSGGPMIIDYSDQNGWGRTLLFSGGSDTGSLVFFLGNQGVYGKTISVRGCVPGQNWVGKYTTPDQNPANSQNWKSLMNAKVSETFQYGGIPGGTRFVDVAVIDGGNHLIFQTRFALLGGIKQ